MAASRLRRPRLLIGIAVVVAAAAAIGVWRWDHALKTGPHAGYVPRDATLAVTSGEFPQWWSRLEGTPTFEGMLSNHGDPLRDWALAVRLATGIRPTPGRWGLWLGRTAAYWRGPDGHGLCVRPGVLARLLHAVGLLGHPDPAAPGAYRWSAFTYRWHDGYVVISARDSGIPSTDTLEPVNASPEGLEIDVRRDTRVTVAIRPEAGLPLRGTVDFADGAGFRTGTGEMDLPEGALGAMAAASVADIHRVLDPLIARAPEWLECEPYRDAFAEGLPGGWDATAGPANAVLTGMDTKPTLPIPEMLLRLPVPAGAELAMPDGAVAAQWDDLHGWVLPWRGDGVAVAVAQIDDTRFLATRESVIPDTYDLSTNRECSTCWAVFRLNWQAISENLVGLARERADFELIPGYNRGDIVRTIVPYLEMLREGGEARVEVRRDENGRFVIEGRLTGGDAAS